METSVEDPVIPAKIRAKIVVTDGGCWEWQGPISDAGYSRIYLNGIRGPGHRLIYRAVYGDIPEGMVLDHACHNRDTECPGCGPQCRHRRCINPAHLEPVTNAENLLRSRLTFGRQNRDKTFCVNGHPLNEANTYRSKVGRQCRPCGTESARNSRAADRAGYLESQRDYYATNREALLAKKKAYDDAHREERNRKRRERRRLRSLLATPVDQ